MPGLSLWLVPPQDSTLYSAIQELITTHIPTLFPGATPPDFFPHVTLTSDTFLSEGIDPQKWLDSLPLPLSQDLEVFIREVEVGSIFFKKVTMRCDKTEGLKALATACREAIVEDVETVRVWAEEKYLPHCSLMYSELDSSEVEDKKSDIESTVNAVQASHKESNRAVGGEVWLVSTNRPLAEWKPIAQRSLHHVNWMWD